ncbi:MAG: NUDIX hydrolase [Crocinitomicaceae bacterium]|nr:NUDIX hydrolase [Flavobacteriales bacterium]NQZ34392.1 NUDIX hydrolase [Crocinitomicaceae bacterium]
MYKNDLNNFFSYSFSVDCVIFGFKNGEINALMIKRSKEPFLNHWAIPGDLVYPDEDLQDAATRILTELTNISNLHLHQAQTFGNPNRHPKGRVITTAYFALIRNADFQIEASSFAEEVKWVPIHEVPDLAFDHNLILNSTYDLLKQKLFYEPICFDLLPEKFTLNQMQQLFEYVNESEMDKANFRKKIRPIPLIALGEKQQNVKHRPAKLFSFDSDKYLEIAGEDGYQFKI